jgi:uncharacterized repeat protein (TIGR01451 family)
VEASKAVALLVDQSGNGEANPGDTLAYTVILVNNGPVPANGVVFTDTPDANTTLVNGSVTTTAGTVTGGNGPGDSAIGVDAGTLAANGGTVTIAFQVTVDDPLPAGVQQVVNQGTVSGSNFASVLTDDPAQPGAAEPTVIVAGAPAPLAIPTLGEWGVMLLMVLLAGLGVRRIAAG